MKQFNVTGMSCAACAARVEKAVLKVEGVTSCAVNLLTNSMGVEGTASDEAVISAVKAAGYGAYLKGGAQKAADGDLKDGGTRKLLVRFLISLVFLLALMYISMGHMMWSWRLPPFMERNCVATGLVQLILSAIIMVINQKFFINGYKSLFKRAPNMDALVALGSTAAFAYSTVMLFLSADAQAMGDGASAMKYMDEMYFESAATVLTLITLGKMLESRAKGKTTDAIKSLMRLAPATASVIRGGEEMQIPAGQVIKGDIFVVRPGENIPVDGVVIGGSGSVDESALTGESIPADKVAGSFVSAGTVNLYGFLKCEALKVGEDTALSQIIKTVESAAATKAPVAKIADKVSGVFVPAVMGIAAVVFAAWMIAGYSVGFSLARAISVLVISCPCALGLATPVAVMVGSGKGAKNGILFKTAASLEQTGRAQIAVLDKTGTVTKGKPQVTDILPCGEYDSQSLLKLACSLETKSGHPLAKAVIAAAESGNIAAEEVDDFKTLPGKGLTATLKGSALCGGNYEFVSESAAVPGEMRELSEKLSGEGKTPLFFSQGGVFCGIIAVADVIKDDAKQAVQELKDMGLRVVMLTGDNERTANAVGRQVGADEVIAGVLPDGKEKAVRELKKKGNVIMVGDGINDAPALTAADTGMAIGAGTDVAIDAAGVVLMKSDLADVPAAIRLSRATLLNVRENLFWAFIYNSLGIPLAAGAFIPLLGWQLSPMFGAAAMSLSSFCVVMNALRLNLFDIRKKRRKRKPLVKENNDKEVKNMEKILKIEGMMCGHCEARVKKALEGVDGVESAEVSHTAGTAKVTLKKDLPDAALIKAVEEQDYKVISVS